MSRFAVVGVRAAIAIQLNKIIIIAQKIKTNDSMMGNCYVQTSCDLNENEN
jgi:hypothetical protein